MENRSEPLGEATAHSGMKTQTRLVEPKASKNSTLSADPQASSKPLGAWAQRLDATAWFQAPKVTGWEEKQCDPSSPPS